MMEKDKLESLLIDYIDGRVDQSERKMIEEELRRNPEAQRLYKELNVVIGAMDNAGDLKPSQSVSEKFDRFLQEEIRRTNTKIITMVPWYYKMAAAIALVIIGGGIGYWISDQQSRRDDLVDIKSELELTKQLVMSRLSNDQSPSQRIMGVKTTYDIQRPDDEIVSILVKTMNEDPNSNVRLAALDALSKFADQAHVRQALIGSLSIQKDPVVQIALIQLMVRMKEKTVTGDLQKIINDEHTIQVVKDEAHIGLLKLS